MCIDDGIWCGCCDHSWCENGCIYCEHESVIKIVYEADAKECKHFICVD